MPRLPLIITPGDPDGIGPEITWKSLKAIGGQKSYELGGAFGDAKGQPGQSNSVSHGCVPSLFQQTNIINTGRRA